MGPSDNDENDADPRESFANSIKDRLNIQEDR
jgi:hypothetical protein